MAGESESGLGKSKLVYVLATRLLQGASTCQLRQRHHAGPQGLTMTVDSDQLRGRRAAAGAVREIAIVSGAMETRAEKVLNVARDQMLRDVNPRPHLRSSGDEAQGCGREVGPL